MKALQAALTRAVITSLLALLGRSAKARRAAADFLAEEEIRIGGLAYVLPGLMRCRLSLEGDREPWLDAAFAFALGRSRGAFLDIGTNRGQSLGKKLAIAPYRPYIAFEPQTICAEALRIFVARIRLRNHRIAPVGLADTDGLRTIWFREGKEADAAASIVEGYRPADFYARTETIAVLRGDSAVQNLKTDPISTIKIDVEGAEPEVLAGLRKTIREHRLTMIFEVLHNIVVATGQELDAGMLADRNARAAAISRIFADLGYTVFNIRNGTLRRSEPIRPDVSRDMSTTNYLALPAEEAPEDGFVLPAWPSDGASEVHHR